MALFRNDVLRSFSRAQMNAMLVMLGAGKGGLPRDEAKAKLAEIADNANRIGEQAANRVWKAYFAVRDGKGVDASSDAPADGAPSLNIEEVAHKVAEMAISAIEKHVDDKVINNVTKHGDKIAASISALVAAEAAKYRQLEVVVKTEDGKTVGKKKPKGIIPAVYDRVLQLAAQGVNTLLVGPAGCGKTHLAAMVADGLGRKYASISCSAGMSESQLAGWLLPVGNSGKFEYVPSQFIEMYEKGGVFLLDEIDSSDPNTLTFINKALANEGFFVPQRFANPYVQKHKDFVCIAAANTFGTGADAQYVGRNQLDAATLDRFAVGMIYMDYDQKVEEALVHAEVLKWGRHIRAQIKTHRLRRIMSTRVMLDITKMVKSHKWTREQWEQGYFAAWSVDERNRISV